MQEWHQWRVEARKKKLIDRHEAPIFHPSRDCRPRIAPSGSMSRASTDKVVFSRALFDVYVVVTRGITLLSLPRHSASAIR